MLIASPSGSTEAKSSSSNKVFFPEEEESEKQHTTNDFPLPAGTRNGSSKYDFVKVYCLYNPLDWFLILVCVILFCNKHIGNLVIVFFRKLLFRS